jgi:hypothetical protein
MPVPEEETIESLTDAVRGIMEILSAHAVMLAGIMRALDENDIEVPGFMQPQPPVH